MSLKVTLAVTADVDMARIAGHAERRVELHAKIAGDAEIFVKKAGAQIAANQHRTADLLGAARTGHLEEAYQGIEGRSGLDNAELIVPGASRLRAAFGSYVLTPQKAKYLTIPVHRESYGRRAGEMQDLFPLRVGPRKTLILARRVESGPSANERVLTRQRPTVRRRTRNPDQGIETMYVLVKKATIPHEPTLIPFDALADEARDSVEEFFDDIIGQAVGGGDLA